MGKWIDRSATIALIALVFYLLFISLFNSIAIACVLTFACCAILLQIRKKKYKKYHMTRFQAQSILQEWAYDSDETTKAQIESLLNFGKEKEIVYLSKHPTATLSMGDVFSAWKKHRNAQSIVVCAVCHSDARARTFAATLQAPHVEILDATRLIPLVQRSDLPPPHISGTKQTAKRIKAMLAELPFHRPWHRSLLAGLGLMLTYLFTGLPAYLALSISALFIAGVSLRSRI